GARLLSRDRLSPRRAVAAAGHGLPLPHRRAAALRLLPLELGADLARPADQPGADAGRSLRLPLAERDLAEARPRGGVLQQGPHRARRAVRDLPPDLPRPRAPQRRARPAAPGRPPPGGDGGRRAAAPVAP